MKYCYHCGRITRGIDKPLFCQNCGRTYDVKLCPRLHVNPRYATCCSQCGSRELSTPQPKVSLWWKLLGFLLHVLSGTLLVFLSISMAVALLKMQVVQEGLVVLTLLLAVLWALWLLLPEWFRNLIYRVVKRKERRHDR